MIELKLSKIGNSKGIRLPSALLKRYQIEDVVVVEQQPDSIVLRPKFSKKLSWKDTAAAMARENENWRGFDAVIADGLESFDRYAIYRADLNPTRGSEINKIQPVVVVSLNVLNEVLETVVICPLTTKLHPTWRSRQQVAFHGKRSEIAVDQISTISKARLISKMGSLAPQDAVELRRLICEMYGEA